MFRRFKSFAVTGLLMLCSASSQSQEALTEKVRFKACDLSKVQTLDWPALGERVQVLTEVKNSEGESPVTLLEISLMDGTVLLSQKGGNFAEAGPLYEDVIDCEYHAFMASEYTISAIRNNDFEIYEFPVDDFSDIEFLIKSADICKAEKLSEFPVGYKTYECERLNRQVELLSEDMTLPVEQFSKLAKQRAPIIPVNAALLESYMHVYDHDSRSFVRLARIGNC